MEMTDTGRIIVARSKAKMLKARAIEPGGWRYRDAARHLDNFADAIEQRLAREAS